MSAPQFHQMATTLPGRVWVPYGVGRWRNEFPQNGLPLCRADGDEIGTVLGIVVILQADGFPAGEGRDVHRRDLRTKVPKIRVKGRAAQVCRPCGVTDGFTPPGPEWARPG